MASKVIREADRMPELRPAAMPLHAAYVALGTCRAANGAIPVTAILDYARHYGLNDRFVMAILELDAEIRRHAASRTTTVIHAPGTKP